MQSRCQRQNGTKTLEKSNISLYKKFVISAIYIVIKLSSLYHLVPGKNLTGKLSRSNLRRDIRPDKFPYPIPEFPTKLPDRLNSRLI